MRVRPESFTDYTLELHGDVWEGIEPSEYVERERRIPRGEEPSAGVFPAR